MLSLVKKLASSACHLNARCICTSSALLISRKRHPEPTKLTDLQKYETESVMCDRVRPKPLGLETDLPPIGFLPRLPDSKEPISTIPKYKPRNAWTEKKALFGQNDYIDILGEPGKARPTDYMPGVPPWLRGFQGNEYQMILIKRHQFSEWRITRPKRFHDLKYRIWFLYKKLNLKTKT